MTIQNDIATGNGPLKGETVSYANPLDVAESAARFIVLEDCGDRLLVQLLNSGMGIAPTERFPSSNYAVCK